jgi:hypothetical protein
VVARPEGSPASGGGGKRATRSRRREVRRGKGSAEPCVMYMASVRPRGGATSTHWLGEQAESWTRQGLSGGGRGSSNSGELAARPEQHAQGRATGDPSGVRSSMRLRRKAAGGGVHREHHWRRQWRLCVRQGTRRRGQLLYRHSCLVEGVTGSRRTLGCGMGKAVAWQAIAVQGRRGVRTAASALGGRRRTVSGGP